MADDPRGRLATAWGTQGAATSWIGRRVHFCLAGIPGTFGAVLLLPGDAFDRSQSYRFFSLFGSEDRWGATLLLVSALGFAGMATKRRTARVASLMLLGTMHWLVALLFILSNPESTGTWTYEWVALLAWLLAWDGRHAAR